MLSLYFLAVDDLPNQSFQTKQDFALKEVHEISFKTAEKVPKFKFFTPKPPLNIVEETFEPEKTQWKMPPKLEEPKLEIVEKIIEPELIAEKPFWKIQPKQKLPFGPLKTIEPKLTAMDKFWADRIKGLEDHKAAEAKIIKAQQIIQAQQKVQPGLRVVEKKIEPKLTAR